MGRPQVPKLADQELQESGLGFKVGTSMLPKGALYTFPCDMFVQRRQKRLCSIDMHVSSTSLVRDKRATPDSTGHPKATPKLDLNGDTVEVDLLDVNSWKAA